MGQAAAGGTKTRVPGWIYHPALFKIAKRKTFDRIQLEIY